MNETFRIYPVTTKEAVEIIHSVNEPHQHDYEELIVGVKGHLEHFIDYGSSLTHAPYISFITRGKVHRVQPVLEEGEFYAWVIRFQSEFLPETIFRLYGIYHEQAKIGRASCRERV